MVKQQAARSRLAPIENEENEAMGSYRSTDRYARETPYIRRALRRSLCGQEEKRGVGSGNNACCLMPRPACRTLRTIQRAYYYRKGVNGIDTPYPVPLTAPLSHCLICSTCAGLSVEVVTKSYIDTTTEEDDLQICWVTSMVQCHTRVRTNLE